MSNGFCQEHQSRWKSTPEGRSPCWSRKCLAIKLSNIDCRASGKVLTDDQVEELADFGLETKALSCHFELERG